MQGWSWRLSNERRTSLWGELGVVIVRSVTQLVGAGLVELDAGVEQAHTPTPQRICQALLSKLV